MSKEDAIEMGVGAVAYAVPALGMMLGMKVSQVRADWARNEEIFKKWGGNILSEKVNQIVWQSDDMSSYVIDLRNALK